MHTVHKSLEKLIRLIFGEYLIVADDLDNYYKYSYSVRAYSAPNSFFPLMPLLLAV